MAFPLEENFSNQLAQKQLKDNTISFQVIT